MTQHTSTAGDSKLGKVAATAIAALLAIWAISQFTESPLEQALGAVGIGDGTSIEEYNEQQRRDGVFDDLNDCPVNDDCAGLDPGGGYNDVPVYPEF